MIYPRLSVSEVTLRFPAPWLPVKRRGLVAPGSGLAITYRGLVGLLHFRQAGLDPWRSLRGQILNVLEGLVACGVIVPRPGAASFPLGIHEFSINLDFPNSTFFKFNPQGFRFSQRFQKTYSMDYRVSYRMQPRADGSLHRVVRDVQDSFLTWAGVGHYDPTLGGETYRLQLRFSGSCAHFVGLHDLEGSLEQVFGRLTWQLGVRLSQVTTPEFMMFNDDLVCMITPAFLQVLRVGGLIGPGPYVRRRLRK